MSFDRLKKRTVQKHKKVDKVTHDEIKDVNVDIEEGNYDVENKKDKQFNVSVKKIIE